MAVRLGRAFRTTPQFWLNLQVNHVVWEFERLQKLNRIRPLRGVVEGVVGNWRRPKPSRRPKHQH